MFDLDQHYEEMRHAARDRLGSLFNASDYPVSLAGAFSMSWDFPSVDPPGYLRQVNPELYEQECDRVRSRFAEAIRLAEEAFTAELSELISHLCERLSDGKRKEQIMSQFTICYFAFVFRTEVMAICIA